MISSNDKAVTASTGTGELQPKGIKAWDVEEAYASLASDPQVHDDLRAADTAKRIFESNLTMAAQSICFLAVHSSNERVRLQAAMHVVDRNLGRVADNPPMSPNSSDPLEQLLKELQQ